MKVSDSKKMASFQKSCFFTCIIEKDSLKCVSCFKFHQANAFKAIDAMEQ